MSKSRQLTAFLYLGETNEHVQPLIEMHQGSFIDSKGSGSTVQFRSALDAVKCAQRIQAINGYNPSQKFSIGIHLGDFVTDQNEADIEGVTLVSGIESIADPGSIYISEPVQGAIRGSGIHTSFRGEKHLPSVDQPVRVYEVVASPEPIPRVKFKKYLPWVALLLVALILVLWQVPDSVVPNKSKTIAVLPMKMNSPDSTVDYLVRGITEELVWSIGKLKDLRVINANSTLRLVASLAPLPEAKTQLPDTDYFVTGSFNLVDNLLYLNLSLHDFQQNEIWSGTYKDDLSKLPEVTAMVAVDIAKEINIHLEEPDLHRIVEIPAMDRDLLELLLKGKNHIFKFTPEDYAIGMNYIKQAKEQHPTNSRAWSMWAELMVYMGHSATAPPGAWQEAKRAATRAIQLDSSNAEAWAALAHTKTYFEWDYDGAVRGYHKANSLNPNLAMNHYHYAWHLWLFDSLDKAIEEHTLAQELDPLTPSHSAWLAWLYVEAGDFVQARIEVKRSLRIADNPDGYFNMGRIYMELEQYDSAALAYQRAGPWVELGLGLNYFRSGQAEKGMEIIRKMEDRPMNSFLAHNLADLYAEADSLDRFFHYRNYEPAHAFAPWTRHHITNPKVLADPRFKDLMDKMNLPMPLGRNE